MKNNTRFKKLISDHYDGIPWLDVSFISVLENISSTDAAKNIAGLNSIWQLVHHTTQWRLTLIKRMKDKSISSPDDNYLIQLTDTSEESWQHTKKEFEKSQNRLMKYLSDDNKWKWDEKSANGNYSRFELMNAILQHDAYHLGQIVLIKKLLAQGL